MSTTDPRHPAGAVPAGGYLPPDEAFPAERVSGHEQLVNLPAEGLRGWFRKVLGVLRRGWQQQLAVFTITHVLPAFVLYALALAAVLGYWNSGVEGGAWLDFYGAFVEGDLVYLAIILVVLLAALPLRLLGYAAATWSAVRQAAGLPAPLGRALAYGVRRAPAVFGWSLVAYALVFAGVVLTFACFASVISAAGFGPTLLVLGYGLMIAGMVGPAVLFERRRPLRRAFNVVNDAFWKTAVRMLLPGVILYTAYSFNQVVTGAEAAWWSTGTPDGQLALAVGAVALSAALELPAALALFPAVLVTYAEWRAVGAPNVRTPHLLEELD